MAARITVLPCVQAIVQEAARGGNGDVA